MSGSTVARTLVALLLVLAHALAQPYAADGGFDRPREGFAVTRASLAAVVDAGVARVLIGDASGARVVTLRPGEALADAPTRGLSDAVVRGVAAADGWLDGDAVYAWFERDTRSGEYRYWWSWRDETRALRTSLQALDLALALGPAGPEALVAVPAVAGGRLERSRWDEAATSVVVQSDRTVAAPAAAYDADGRLHLAYLEGATVDTPLGQTSEWAVVYHHDDREQLRIDGALGPPGSLVLEVSTAPGVLAWSREDGVAMALPLSDLGAAPVPLGAGRPFGATVDSVLWTRSGSLVVTGPLRDAVGARASHNVAWSPYAVAQASATRADGVTYLVWTGTEAGGGGRVLVSDDAAAFAPTLVDHLAAWFGWTPWAVAEEAAGQATGALLVGVLGTMVLLPLLWLLSLPLARRVDDRRARSVGAALAVAVVAALGLAAVARAASVGNDAWDLLGGGWGFGLALLLALWLPPLLLRRVDLEVQPALLISSGLAAFVGLSVTAFVAFQPWLRVLGV